MGLELDAESIKVIKQTKDLAGRRDSTAHPYLWSFIYFGIDLLENQLK